MDTDQGKSRRSRVSSYQRREETGKETRPHLGGLENIHSHIQRVYQTRHWDSTGTKTDHKQADRSARKTEQGGTG